MDVLEEEELGVEVSAYLEVSLAGGERSHKSLELNDVTLHTFQLGEDSLSLLWAQLLASGLGNIECWNQCLA